MLTTYVTRGVKAGLVAGLVFGLFVALVANPLVAFADEVGHDEADHAGEEATGEEHESVVSATVTNVVSVASSVLWGVLLGGVVFGVLDYFLEPLVPGSGGTKSYLLAAGGFVTVSGAPWLLLPPQPPGVDRALATETGVLLYGGMLVAGALVCLLAAVVYDRLRPSHGRPVAAGVAMVPFGLLAIPAVLSPLPPASSSLPPALASGLLGTIVFGQCLLWLSLAATHARLRGASSGGPTDGSENEDSLLDTPVTAD